MELLRFTTAGSVDDGKSTLIGRMLYDSKSIFEDQLTAVETASRSRGNEELNLALLTDGLRAEREQGITIDVAYRYFATPRRKFIIADTPGHVEYTRNMATGASTANLAVILVDSRNGVVEQTVRHSFIASLLGIRHIVVCVNKMDLVGYSAESFDEIHRHGRAVGHRRSELHTHLGQAGRQRGGALDAHAMVRRPHAARPARNGAHRRHRAPATPPTAGAARHPTHLRRLPRLPQPCRTLVVGEPRPQGVRPPQPLNGDGPLPSATPPPLEE